MFRRALLLPALAGLVQCQTITSSAAISNPTPDALPVDDLRDFDIPVYTETPGLDSDIVQYATATAVAAASADVASSPLSVFPAATEVPINAAGEDSADPSKRSLGKRAACDAQATIANYYSVNVDSYSAFKADPTISSVALAAPTPSGYFSNFKNAPGANSAYAYLGYAVVNKGKTGYDTNWCATKCNSISGCLSFNIYFERDPIVEPGSGCENPAAFANLKCSFWGTALDSTTANNYGQWRSNFQVGIAGSNAYTSYKVGGPIDNWSAATKLNTSVMNAPLYDCSNTWTYLGYKLYQSGPYDPQLCAAACDAQTAYNAAHPPSDSKPVKCAAFGSYILTMTNKTSSYQLGQMCTLYTSNWDKQYAVNTVSYDDGIGAKYTYSYSFFYSKPDIQPICQSDINYLRTSGADFCTSFNGYSAPVTTATATNTPPVVVDLATSTSTSSAFVFVTTGKAQVDVPTNIEWKRDDATSTDGGVLSNTATYTTVASVPESTAVTLATFVATVTAANGTVPTDAPDNIVAPPEKRDMIARAIATPASIAGWPSSRISEACSAVATGTITNTVTVTLAPSHTTSVVPVVVATTLTACAVPSQNPEYSTFTPVWGKWSGDTLQDLGYSVAQQEKTIQLPFTMQLGSVSSNVIRIAVNGYIGIGDNSYLGLFQGQGRYLYIYGGSNGVFYRITGAEGSRQLVVAWYTGTYNYGHMQEHFTFTYFEATNTVQYKYYDIVQSGLYQAQAYATINGQRTDIVSGTPINAGDQYQLKFNGNSASVSKSTHNRVECCVKRPDNWFGGWHSCTEFQPAKES